MLIVYAVPPSLYCAKLRILLRHKGLDWDERLPPGGYGSSQYKAIVPSGNLPALVDGDLVLGDSEAIAEYIEQRFEHPPMLPADPAAQAKVRERGRFHDTRLEPEVRKLFGHIAPSGRDTEVVVRQALAIKQRLEQLAVLLSAVPEPPGSPLTLAECGFPISFAWLDELAPALGFTIDWPPAIVAYRARLGSEAAVADELASYLPTLRRWLITALEPG